MLFLTDPSWSTESAEVGAELGWSVAEVGDVNGDGWGDVVVGVPLHGMAEEGEVRLYLGHPAGLESASWSIEGTDPEQQLGLAVAGVGDVNDDGYDDIAVSAYVEHADVPGQVWIFYGSPDHLAEAPDQVLDGGVAGTRFGYAIAGGADINGDTVPDIVVGAPDADAPATQGGAVYGWWGTAAGVPAVADKEIAGSNPTGHFGCAVHLPGDVNGDGEVDLLVGACDWSQSADGQGAAFWFRGGAGGPQPGWVTLGEGAFERYGASVGGADVNGDGYVDILVGAPQADGGSGVTYVYHGGEAGPGETADTRISAPAEQYTAFGRTVVGAGDVDGDGYEEVATCAIADTVFLFPGSPEGTIREPSSATVVSETASAFGQSLSGGRDVNADGYADLLIGAPTWSVGQEWEGAAFLYQGGPPDADLDGDPDVTDCDPANADIYTGAPEICNSVDDDCDGVVDGPAADGAVTWYADADGDGFGDAAVPQSGCTPPDDAVVDATDCDDGMANVYPGAAERPGDGQDGDCDGTELCYADRDDDGSRPVDGSTTATDDLACAGEGLADATLPPADCDDSNAAITGLVEVCDDGLDNDCDIEVDEACDAKDTSGCGCASGGPDVAGTLGLLAVLGLILRRRR